MSDPIAAPQSDYPDGYPYAPRESKIVVPGSIPIVSSSQAWSVLEPPLGEILLLAAGGAFNFLIVPLVTSFVSPSPPPLIGVMYGVFAGQLGGLSIWLVWSRGSLLKRLAIYGLLMYGLLLCFLLGVLVGEPPSARDVARATAFGLPFVSLSVQLPLWLFRSYLGWEIVAEVDSGILASHRALSIGDMLAGTTLAAIAISAVRFASIAPGYPNMSNWIGWAVAIPSIAGVSLVSLPPIILCALWLKRLRDGLWVLSAYSALTMVVTLIAILHFNRPLILTARPLVGVVALIVTFTATLFSTLLLARARGLRLKVPIDLEFSHVRDRT
jgi:hypothetical protein